MTPGDREGAAVERQRLADDLGSAPSRRQSALEITAPWSSSNHRPTIGLTPRLWASDGVTSSADDVLRLAREGHVEAGRPEPAERVEAPRALLVLLTGRETCAPSAGRAR